MTAARATAKEGLLRRLLQYLVKTPEPSLLRQTAGVVPLCVV